MVLFLDQTPSGQSCFLILGRKRIQKDVGIFQHWRFGASCVGGICGKAGSLDLQGHVRVLQLVSLGVVLAWKGGLHE